MRDKTRWNKRVFALAMTAALSVGGVMAGPAVTVWAIPASGTAVSDNIVVRNSAVSGDQVGGLSEGQAVSIEDETTGSDGNTWYQISYTVDGEERSGWVRGDLLETSDESLDEDSDADESDAEAAESASLEFDTLSGSITLTDIPEEELSLVSDRFVEASLEFAEGAVTALQLAEPDELVADDASIVDFYYVYGYNEIGESGWYVYNADDGTIQKNLLNMQYSAAETEENEAETASDFSSDSLTKMAFSLLAVVGLLLLVLTIIFSARYRRLRRILEEEIEEDEEEAPKRTAAEPKRKNDSEERVEAKTKKKTENPEPVKVRKGTAQPVGEKINDRQQKENVRSDAKKPAGEASGTEQTAGVSDRAERISNTEQAEIAKTRQNREKPEESRKTAGDYAGEAADKHREKASSVKKNKRKNASVQETPVSEPMSEIGGVDVLDLDSMDDTDFEALLNRYIEEDLASGMNGDTAESAGIPDDQSVPDTGIQKDDMVWENQVREDIQTEETAKQEAEVIQKTPARDIAKQEADASQKTPARDAVKRGTGTARKSESSRIQEKKETEWLDDYDIPLVKEADYDIPALDESDSMDLSKLKMSGEKPEYYDDDDDLEFL
ncbi:MAG: SH3 domain-containing protein [Clostridiales bacterium]|nr:SH3 domain-containing protein [Clostridiales bacterium]